ncbi:MAG: L-lactate permease [Micrococcaceae bacterium]
MSVFMAVLPILITLGLLPLPRIPAAIPPLLGTLSAGLIAVFYFHAPRGDLVEAWNGSFWTLVKVLAIIGGGVLLSRVMDRTGAQRRLAGWLSAGGPTVASAMLMAHGVVPFLETVTGFGVSVLIGLPLLLSFGFTPYRAALLTLVGLMIGPWGSMGPGTLLGANIAGVSMNDLGLASGVFNLIAFLASGVAAAVIAGHAAHEATSSKATWKEFAGWCGIGVSSGVGLWLLVLGANFLLGTAVAGATATLLVAIIWLLIIRRGRLTPGPGLSLVPYVSLLAGTISGQMLYRNLELGAFGEIISSPALWSTLAALAALTFLPIQRRDLRRLPREAGLMWWQVSIPTALYVLLGVIVAGGGLAAVLAESLALLGPVYLFLMPMVAGLSGYITASGTGANAMIGATQVAAGAQLGVSPLWAMAVQNSAANWAIIASPARLELAYRLASPYQRPDTPGHEISRGRLLSRLIPLVLGSMVLYGLAMVVAF